MGAAETSTDAYERSALRGAPLPACTLCSHQAHIVCAVPSGLVAGNLLGESRTSQGVFNVPREFQGSER